MSPELAATSRSLSLYTVYSGICNTTFGLLKGLVGFFSATRTTSSVGATPDGYVTSTDCAANEDTDELNLLEVSLDESVFSF
jgi:hypothetical protein